jgi:hypothetical protein
MEVSELRVGIFVLSKRGEVFFLTQGRLAHYLANPHLLERLSPIPITEEWLKRMGFVKDDVVYVLSKRETLIYDPEDSMVAIGNWFERSFFNVHEIQNLYHAITGKELEILKELP